jgi:hypothetical protein
MNAIIKALTDLPYTVPVEILNIAFYENSTHVNTIIPLEERITTQVIRQRVLQDLNIVGGVEIRIDTGQCFMQQVNYNEFTIQVPKAVTGGRSIVSVLSLVANSMMAASDTAYTIPQQTENAMLKMYNNLASANVIQTSRLELIGENMVLVQDPNLSLINSVLRCTVENNNNLENIHPRSYLDVSKLVSLAVKSFVYSRLKIKLDQGYIYGGHELGVITEIVDSYADAEELYQEFLRTKMRKILFMNNRESVNRLIKSMLSNNI